MRHHPRFTWLGLLITLILFACGGSRDETVSGVTLPVPKAMKKGVEKPVELSFLGFGAGQATFHGDMETEKIVEFYKKELPARGWQQSMNLQTGSTLLAYTKEGKTVLIGVGKQDRETVLSLTVGGTGK
jgi:hypothetical protein